MATALLSDWTLEQRSSVRGAVKTVPRVDRVSAEIPEGMQITVQRMPNTNWRAGTPSSGYGAGNFDIYRPQLVVDAGFTANQSSDQFRYWPPASKWDLVTPGPNDNALIRNLGTMGGSGPGLIEFMTDAPSIELLLKDGGGGGTARNVIYVDGVRQGQDGFPFNNLTGHSVGTFPTYRVTFMGGAKPRRIGLMLSQFGGVMVQKTYSVWAPTNHRVKAIVIGDSFTEGTGQSVSNPSNPSFGVAGYLGDFIGWDVYPSGLGATGWFATSSGSRQNFYERRQSDVIDLAPDVVIWCGGINDGVTGAGVNGASTTLQAQAEATIAAVKSALPQTRQIVVGGWFPRDYTNPTYADANAVARAAALQAAAAAQEVEFISVDKWITGRREASTGNAVRYISSDNTHPSTSGHKYLARRLAAAVAELDSAPIVSDASAMFSFGTIGYTGVPIATTGTPLDIGTVEVQGGDIGVTMLEFKVDGNPSGTLAAATIEVRDALAGGGNVVMAATALSSLTSSGAAQRVKLDSEVRVTTGRLVVRQTVPSSNTGVVAVNAIGHLFSR